MARQGASRDERDGDDEFALWVEAKTTARTPRALWGLVRSATRLAWAASPRGLTVAAGLQVVTAVGAGLTVLVGQRVLADLLGVADGDDVGRRVVVDVLLLAAVTALTAAAPVFQVQHQRELGERVGTRVWDGVLAVTTTVPLEDFERPRFHALLQRVQSHALARPVAVATGLLGIAGSAVGAVSLLVAVLAVAPELLPLLAVSSVPALLLSRRAARTEFGFAVSQNDTYRRRNYLRTLLTSREAAAEIRTSRAGGHLRRRQDAESASFLAALTRQVRLRQRYAGWLLVTNAVTLSLTLVVLVLLVERGSLGVASAGAALIGVRMLSSRVDVLVSSVASLFEAEPFLRDLEDFLAQSAPPDERAPADPPWERGLSLHGVSFRYPGRQRTVLHDVDLTIGPGEVVALVGENGSGKSTLAKVAAGLYLPTAGRVERDGIDLATLPAGDAAGHAAMVFQDFLRYRLTATENVGLGDPVRLDDQAAVERAAAAAGAHDVLAALPAGYATMLSKEYAGGADLSGGQWQRVALARALFRDAPLVVLDEPSSSLDARAESELFEDVRRLLRGRSALLISHRFSTVRLVDRIYVLHDGRVVDHGTHDELVARGGRYAEMFALQARSYL
jgi:ATP-binding cassette subfamily B protein